MTELVKQALGKAALPLAVALAAVSAIAIPFLLGKDLGMDFDVYWRAAHEPLPQVYADRDTMPFPYPPTMLLWISPIVLMQKWAALAYWTGLGMWALAASCRRHLSWAEILLVLFSPPAVYCLLQGQVSLLLAAGLLWACTTERRNLAGLAFAVIASVKPQMVIMAPLLLAMRFDWRALSFAAIGFVSIIAASVVLFGTGTWAAWFASLENFRSVVLSNGVLGVMITPAGVAQNHGLQPLPFMLGGALIGIWLIYRAHRLQPLAQSAAIATASLLAAPYAVIYDLVAVVPFLVWAVFRGQIAAAVALSGGLNPLPLLLTGYVLASAEQDREAAPSM